MHGSAHITTATIIGGGRKRRVMSSLPKIPPSRFTGGRRANRMTPGERQKLEERKDEYFSRKPTLVKAPIRPHASKFLSIEHAEEIKKWRIEKREMVRARDVSRSVKRTEQAISEIERELEEAQSTQSLMKTLKSREEGEDAEKDEDPVGSRNLRLSRAARFGNKGPPNRTLLSLPEGFVQHSKKMFDAEDKVTLRAAFRRKTAGEPIRKLLPQRLAVLHMLTASSIRYGAARIALKHIRTRLGPDLEPDMRNETLSDQWTPTRIVEYNCGVGEGMWAAAEVFGEEATRAGRVLSYEGYDTRVPLLRVAVDMLDSARARAEEVEEDAELTPSQTTQKALASMNISLRTASKSANLAVVPVRGVVEDSLPVEPAEGNGTLVLCNHVLMNLENDKQRSDFVKTLWERHPSAEVIALVEEGSERGFACIASAREDLLGIGVRSAAVFGKGVLAGSLKDASKEAEEIAKVAKGWPECHVVAPCPHDRPCPLLHDYKLIDGQDRPAGTSNPDTSSLFQGARIGQAHCTTPYDMSIPSFSSSFRPQGLNRRKDEHGQMSYVIVRRGPRPGMTEKSDRLTSSRADAATLRAELRLRAARTKVGVLAELRRGERMQPAEKTVAMAEELDNNDAAAAAAMTGTSGADDAEARDQLLRMLPGLLQQHSKADGDGTDSEAQDAMRLAQRIMEQSAELADGKVDDSVAVDEREATAATGDLLEQQRLLAALDKADEATADDAATAAVALQKEDIESMRAEAYEWPRLIATPLKRAGHVILDGCSANGAIVRFIVAKSSGQQMYQDARKAFWGGTLPYVPILEEPQETTIDKGDATSDDATASQTERTILEVQNIKTVIQRIPAASLTERNDKYTTDKMKAIPRRKRNKMPNRLPEITWPASSALAIGADLIAQRYVPDLPFAWRADGFYPSRKLEPKLEVPAVHFSRRSHYTSGDGRGAERLRESRTSRKNTRLQLTDAAEAYAALEGEEGRRAHEEKDEDEGEAHGGEDEAYSNYGAVDADEIGGEARTSERL